MAGMFWYRVVVIFPYQLFACSLSLSCVQDQGLRRLEKVLEFNELS